MGNLMDVVIGFLVMSNILAWGLLLMWALWNFGWGVFN